MVHSVIEEMTTRAKQLLSDASAVLFGLFLALAVCAVIAWLWYALAGDVPPMDFVPDPELGGA